MKATDKTNLLLTKKPLTGILLFALPIFLGNIFQQLYNVVDTAIIGNVLGENSLAAVGATAAIYNLIIGFASGMTNGFSVVLARFFGAGEENEMKKTVSLTVVLTALVSVVLTIGSLLLLNPLLHFLNTPESIMSEAVAYLKIILQFSVVTMFYNMFAGLLRAIGDSRTPLYILIVASLINGGLDMLFVKGFSWGIGGAAYATVIAQSVSVLLCVWYVVKKCPLLMVHRKYIQKDMRLIQELSTTGLSMGLMLAIVSIGSVALQSAVNAFGPKVIAAHTAARKIDDIFMLPLGTLSMAASTFASQNYGAGNKKRVKDGIRTAILLAFAWSGLSCVISWLGGSFMICLLTGTTDDTIIETALRYIHINIPFFFVLSILLILRSSLQGLGRKIVPLTASTVELLGKFVVVGWLAPVLGYLGVCIIEPIIWGICMLLVSIDYCVFLKKNIVEHI